jgi:hypothetical protein
MSSISLKLSGGFSRPFSGIAALTRRAPVHAPGTTRVVHREVEPGAAALKAVGSRTYRAVASTSAVDRHGDVVEQDGWQLGAYKKNPVVMWAHDYESLPVAKATSIKVERGRLMIEFAFPEVGVS